MISRINCCPTICEEIKSHYQVWLKEERKRKYAAALTEVWAYLESDIVRKSRKNALKTIRARTIYQKTF